MKKTVSLITSSVMALIVAIGLTGCGSSSDSSNGSLSGTIRVDGSSTVFPISQAIAEEFMAKNSGVQVTVGESGTGGGFKKLIAGEIEIADASREIKKPKDGIASEAGKETELELLQAKGEEPLSFPIAFDGITLVINKKNTFATEMTVDELKKIWQKDSTVKNWSDVRAGWPNEEIKLYGPGTASGTFDFFTKAINGVEKESRADYTQSEDDNVLVKGVQGDEFSLGYFGFAYYEENKDKLTAVKVKLDDATAAVEPSIDSIKSGAYKPLSRKLFVYTTKNALKKPEVKAFLQYYNSPDAQKLIDFVKSIHLPAEDYEANLKLLQ